MCVQRAPPGGECNVGVERTLSSGECSVHMLNVLQPLASAVCTERVLLSGECCVCDALTLYCHQLQVLKTNGICMLTVNHAQR